MMNRHTGGPNSPSRTQVLGHGTDLFPAVFIHSPYSVAPGVAASLFSLSFPQDSHAPAHFEDNVSQLYCEYVSLGTVQQGKIPSAFPPTLTKLWTLEKAYGQADDLKHRRRESHPILYSCHVEWPAASGRMSSSNKTRHEDFRPALPCEAP